MVVAMVVAWRSIEQVSGLFIEIQYSIAANRLCGPV